MIQSLLPISLHTEGTSPRLSQNCWAEMVKAFPTRRFSIRKRQCHETRRFLGNISIFSVGNDQKRLASEAKLLCFSVVLTQGCATGGPQTACSPWGLIWSTPLDSHHPLLTPALWLQQPGALLPASALGGGAVYESSQHSVVGEPAAGEFWGLSLRGVCAGEWLGHGAAG